MTDITPENVARYSSYQIMWTTDGHPLGDPTPTGKYVLFDDYAALYARLAEVQAMAAAAVMEAADAVNNFFDCLRDDDEWHLSDLLPLIHEVTPPDAMAALHAYRDREVAKALREVAASEEIEAMIPEVKP
jgi:hypothetical protein